MAHMSRRPSSRSGSLDNEVLRLPARKILNVKLDKDVQLHKSANAWRPSVNKEVTSSQVSKDKKTEELVQSFRSILNKLTPEKFDQLMMKVTELQIDTIERIRHVAELVHEKAISEPSFSVTYSRMCRNMANLKDPSKPSKARSSFKSILLRFCLEQFNKDQEKEDSFAIKQKEMEAAPAGEQAILRQELAEAKAKARRCTIGNIIFIGELYKRKMLKVTIIKECLTKSLKEHDDEILECLCKLLTTVGKELDVGEGKIQMDEYIHQMETLVKERKTSTRIHFMMQDVMDLRLNVWVPRRAHLGPKTITQIHEEAKREEEMKQQKVSLPLFKELKKEDESPILLRPQSPWFFSPAPIKREKQPELPRTSSPALSEDSGLGEEIPELPLSQIPASASSQSEESVENLQKPDDRNPEGLLQNVSAMHIDTEEQLNCVVEMVYKKAISEPSSSGSYASMCRSLATLRVPMKNKPYIDVGFKSLLLQFCWKQIEKDQDVRCLVNSIKVFIELFKQKLLTEAVMQECVVKLLKRQEGKTLECLCHLLTSVGKEMDVGEAKSRMDAHFTQLKNLVKEQKSGSKRIRNMMKDILVLRMNDRVPQETKQQKVL